MIYHFGSFFVARTMSDMQHAIKVYLLHYVVDSYDRKGLLGVKRGKERKEEIGERGSDRE